MMCINENLFTYLQLNYNKNNDFENPKQKVTENSTLQSFLLNPYAIQMEQHSHSKNS